MKRIDGTSTAPADAPSQGLGRAWPGLLTLMLATFAAVTTEMLPVGLLPSIGAEFGLTESVTGLLVSLYAVMVAVLAVPLTLLTARLPRKALLLATLAAYTVSNLVVALAPNVAIIATGRTLGGISHALFFSVAIGYATRLVSKENTGRALAIASAGISAGFILGVPLGVSLGTALGWRAAFGALAVFIAATLALAVVTLPPIAAAGLVRGIRRERVRSLVAVIATNGLVYLGHYTFFTYVSVLLLTSGAAPEAVGPWLLAFGVVGLLGLLIAARQLDTRPLASALVIVALIAVGIAGVALGYPALPLVIAAGLVWNFGFGPSASLFQAAAVHVGAVSPDLAGAWINAASNAGIAVGAVIGGLVLATGGITAVAWTAAGIVVAAVVIVAAAPRAFAPQPFAPRA